MGDKGNPERLLKLWWQSRRQLRTRVVAVKWREVNDFEKHLEMEPIDGLAV